MLAQHFERHDAAERIAHPVHGAGMRVVEHLDLVGRHARDGEGLGNEWRRLARTAVAAQVRHQHAIALLGEPGGIDRQLLARRAEAVAEDDGRRRAAPDRCRRSARRRSS